MNLAFKLYRLQQVDSQLDEHRERLDAIAAQLADDKALQQARARAEAKADKLAERQRELRRAEYKTGDQRRKIEQTENKLYSGRVTNPKELQDLQNESAALKRYLAVLEERQLETMLHVDEAAEEAEAAQQALTDTEGRTAENRSALRGEQSQRQAAVDQLEEERQAALEGIDPEDLAVYEKLRRQKGGIAVARVTEKSCSACGSTLSAALSQQARSPDATVRCETCKRILYAY